MEAADEFDPNWRFIMAFVSLAVLTLMVALDATSLSVALPVSYHDLPFPCRKFRERY